MGAIDPVCELHGEPLSTHTCAPKCLLCGKDLPPGRVRVSNLKGEMVGYVCAAHTLAQIILSDVFNADVTTWDQ